MIIIVFGLPGSGKSYFASLLAQKLKAAYLNSDKERKKIMSQRTYSESEKMMVYDLMLQKMKTFVQEGKSLVLDATFYKNKIREKFITAAKGKTPIEFIEMRAAEALIKKRISKTRADTEADFDVYKTVKNLWEPLEEEHLVLHSRDDNSEELLHITLDYLKAKDDKRSIKQTDTAR